MAIRPKSVVSDTAIVVNSGTDLCAMLRPGFEEWRDGSPKLPVDLNDIDGRKEDFFFSLNVRRN
jgi:hypothetical protein